MSGPAPAPVSGVDYIRQHEVETPESVVLQYEIAGLGSRGLAATVDHLLIFLLAWAVIEVLDAVGDSLPWHLADAAEVMIVFAIFAGYFLVLEALQGGQTPGKRMAGIRVVSATGHPITFGASAARNLVRLADFLLPPPYLTGMLLILFHPRAQRLGDLVAGTVVVRDRPIARTPEQQAATEPASAPVDAAVGAPRLSEEEFRLLRDFHERAGDLDPDSRQRLTGQLASRFASRVSDRGLDEPALLAELYREEYERRRSRLGVGRGGGGRFIVRQASRWREFQALAERAAQQGLDSFAAPELPGFAARYREVAADLARARTYRADPALLAQLERLVAAGHNALYREERKTGQRILDVLLRECPAAVVEARRYVLIAMLCFMAPAAAGFLVLRDRPALAAELLPDAMLRRAEAGAARRAEGKGYYEAEGGERPFMASAIITNNVQVALTCFAGGIILGVGSFVMLAFNGLEIGLSAGHFANRGLLGYLLAFIVGHGVLELFAIWVAGAAGFLLGRAMIAPGDLTRADALVVNGRLAVRMVGVVVVLLLVAGTIEGFVSASAGGLPLRLAVSGASVVFLALYLLNGARFLPAGGRQSAFDQARSSQA